MILLLSACHSSKQILPTEPPAPITLNNSDSVRVEKVIETIYVPVDVAVDLPQQSETNAVLADSSHVETDLSFSDAWLADGVLHHFIKNKPGQLKGSTYVPQTTEHNNKDAVHVREVPVPQPYPVYVEKSLTRTQQFKLAAFWYLVGLALVAGIYIFKKPLLMLVRKIV